MAEAPVLDRPNIHSKPSPWQPSILNMNLFWAFKISRIRRCVPDVHAGTSAFRQLSNNRTKIVAA